MLIEKLDTVRLAPEDTSMELTGYGHNAVTCIGMKTDIPQVECISLVGMAVGKEKFRADANQKDTTYFGATVARVASRNGGFMVRRENFAPSPTSINVDNESLVSTKASVGDLVAGINESFSASINKGENALRSSLDTTTSFVDSIVKTATKSVFPGAWTAILVSLDNAGIWNLRPENLNSWYLGQEVYVHVVNSEKDNNVVV
ncbi:hypothetical protein JHK86_048142 [Glycine max]|nr:hypothetical protein JHK86_048142 [Glycine max]